MPVKNCIHKISDRSDRETQLLQNIIPTTFNRFCVNLHYSHVLEEDLLEKGMVISPESQIENCSLTLSMQRVLSSKAQRFLKTI